MTAPRRFPNDLRQGARQMVAESVSSWVERRLNVREQGFALHLKLGARYYNPTTGRFTQPDPAVTCGGYAYASDNPTNATDPSGRCSSFWTGMIGFGASSLGEGSVLAADIGGEGLAGLVIVGPEGVAAAAAITAVPLISAGLGWLGCKLMG